MSRPLPILGRDPRPGPRPHVTLVRPPLVAGARQWSNVHTPPIGIAYLAGTLRAHGFPVGVVDAMSVRVGSYVRRANHLVSGMSTEEILDAIDPSTEIIGVSCMFTQDWPIVREIVNAIGERFPDALLVAGGEHVTALPELCMSDCPSIDLCVMGEGEETLLDLAYHAHDPDALRRRPGIAMMRDGALVTTKPRSRIREVSAIPRPAWDLFPMEAYLDHWNGFGVYRGRTMAIVATRGCPYQCTFCSNVGMYGTRWVARDPDDVLDEIASYIDDYGAENFDFYDLTMILKREWILDFCRRIKERGLSFSWQLPSGTRAEVVDDEVAAALYEAGCRNIAYSPESGSPDTLRTIKKRVNLDRMRESVKAALRNGLIVRVNMVLGFPHETRKHVMESVAFALEMAALGVHDAAVFIYSPYPGSELFDELQAEGRIGSLDDDYFESLLCYRDFRGAQTYSRHLTASEIAAWRLLAIAGSQATSLALHPRRIFKLLRHLREGRSDSLLEQRLGDLIARRSLNSS